MMKSLSAATAEDYRALGEAFGLRGAFGSAEDAAQALVDLVYERLGASLVLVRVFTTVLFDALPQASRAFVVRKTDELGISHLLQERTPVLALLGTRGRRPEWNERHRSRRFQCIPLASGAFVASLSMLAAQLRAMRFDPTLVDRWDEAFAPSGGGGRYSGVLHVRDAASDRDAQGRIIVPAQDFVAENGVRTVLGFGTSYARHPALATLFAFTDEALESPPAAMHGLLEAYRAATEELLGRGAVFAQEGVAVPSAT